MDASKIAMQKIKEEHLSDSLTEMDFTLASSINPTGDNMDAFVLFNSGHDDTDDPMDAGDDHHAEDSLDFD